MTLLELTGFIAGQDVGERITVICYPSGIFDNQTCYFCRSSKWRRAQKAITWTPLCWVRELSEITMTGSGVVFFYLYIGSDGFVPVHVRISRVMGGKSNVMV